MTDPQHRYRFAGAAGVVWLGLPVVPLLALAAVVVLTVGALFVGAPLPVAVLLLTVGAAVTFVPVGGRGLLEWLSPATGHLVGERRWSTPLHAPRSSSMRLPRAYGRLRVCDLGGVAFIDDRAARVATMVFAVAGSDRFPLLDPAQQARLLAGWGDALAGLTADRRVRRVQWVERAGPDRRDRAHWLTARDGAADAGGDGDLVGDYRRLAHTVTAGAVRHDVWLAVGYDRAGVIGRRGDADGVVREALRSLLLADVLARPLPVAELTLLLRGSVDLHLAEGVPVAVDAVGPASLLRRWHHVRADDSFHCGFVVTGWPRVPVGPGWLEPLLLAAPAGVTRTVSVHLQPVAQAPAVRQARAARTRARLDLGDRARFGLADTAAAHAAAEEAAAAEEELLAGYRLQRLSAVVLVSAKTLPELDEACAAVRAVAASARLDVRPCHGQHDLALLASVPVCRPAGRSRR